MSKKANPAVIGAFILGGIALTIVAVAFLASRAFFSPYQTYVTYFAEPVNGLSVGAPVKYRGIQLGQVDRIGLQATPTGNDLAEVIFRIEGRRLINLGAKPENVTGSEMPQLVREGLRSRLEVESIVTGIVYVTLEFKDDVGPPVLRNPESKYVEVPSGLSPMSELTASAGEVIARLSKIDVVGFTESVLDLTNIFEDKLKELQVARLSDNLALMTENVAVLAGNPTLPAILVQLDSAITEFRETNEVLVELLTELQPSIGEVDTVSQNLNEAILLLAEATGRTSDMLATDAEFKRGLEEALFETAQTMKSLRRLTDMLERNPRALLSGKHEDRK